jgi:hypothetical protein
LSGQSTARVWGFALELTRRSRNYLFEFRAITVEALVLMLKEGVPNADHCLPITGRRRNKVREDQLSLATLRHGHASSSARRLVAEHDRNEITEQATGEHAHEELDRW